jgi:hypothetical protein
MKALSLLLVVSARFIYAFISESPASRASHAFLSGSDNRRTAIYARLWKTKVKKKETVLVEEQPPINGELKHRATNVPHTINITKNETGGEHTKAIEDVIQLMEEFNQFIEDGSKEMFANLTQVMEEKLELVRLPDEATLDLSTYLTNMTISVQKTQRREIERQLKDMESLLVRPLEDLAFSDAALFNKKENQTKKEISPEENQKLVLAGANSTLQESSRSMRTREIIGNLNVAPLYYSITLLNRWFRKMSYPPIYLISSMRGMASLIKWPSPMKKKTGEKETYAEYIKDAELMQAGWKRTGEIAAKGPFAKKWAILRRSAEIWAYFSSFYIKERRMTNKFNSGRWSKEKYSAERSKLGAEVTQNLLKLGPTFIKVGSIILLRDSRLRDNRPFISFRLPFCLFRSANYFPRGSILCQKSSLTSSSCFRTKSRPFLVIWPYQLLKKSSGNRSTNSLIHSIAPHLPRPHWDRFILLRKGTTFWQ